MLLCFTPILKLTADGRISMRYDWRPTFSYDLRRAGYTPSRNKDVRFFESEGALQLEGQANAEGRLHFGVNATVGGVLGLTGTLAPHINGTASFRTPPPTACAEISAAIHYGLTAFADVFVKRWEWDIAKGEFLRRTLYDRCTGGQPAGGPLAGRVLPLTPTTGPMGYSPAVTGPACPGAVHVAADGQSQYSSFMPGMESDGWRLPLNLQYLSPDASLSAGTYRMSFECKDWGEENVVWADAGFDVTWTGDWQPVSTDGDPVTPGGTVNFVSGTTGGGAPCPTLHDGRNALALWLQLYVAESGEQVGERSISLPTASSTESFAVPGNLAPGTTLVARAHCSYEYEGVAASFDFKPITLVVAE